MYFLNLYIISIVVRKNLDKEHDVHFSEKCQTESSSLEEFFWSWSSLKKKKKQYPYELHATTCYRLLGMLCLASYAS